MDSNKRNSNKESDSDSDSDSDIDIDYIMKHKQITSSNNNNINNNNDNINRKYIKNKDETVDLDSMVDETITIYNNTELIKNERVVVENGDNGGKMTMKEEKKTKKRKKEEKKNKGVLEEHDKKKKKKKMEQEQKQGQYRHQDVLKDQKKEKEEKGNNDNNNKMEEQKKERGNDIDINNVINSKKMEEQKKERENENDINNVINNKKMEKERENDIVVTTTNNINNMKEQKEEDDNTKKKDDDDEVMMKKKKDDDSSSSISTTYHNTEKVTMLPSSYIIANRGENLQNDEIKNTKKRKLNDYSMVRVSDKGPKRKRTLNFHDLYDEFINYFNLNLSKNKDGFKFFSLSSGVKNSFICTDKLFLKRLTTKYGTINHVTKEEIENYIRKSLSVLQDYVTKNHFYDESTVTPPVTSYSLSRGLDNTRIYKRISRLVLRGVKKNSKKMDEIMKIFLSILENKKYYKNYDKKRKGKIIVPPGGSIQSLELDIANLLYLYFEKILPRGFMLIYMMYIKKFVTDHNLLEVLFKKKEDILQNDYNIDFDIEYIVKLILFNIIYPKETCIYNFSKEDIIYNFILEERKKLINGSVKHRPLSRDLFCNEASNYMFYLNEMRKKLNMSSYNFCDIFFVPISVNMCEDILADYSGLSSGYPLNRFVGLSTECFLLESVRLTSV